MRFEIIRKSNPTSEVENPIQNPTTETKKVGLYPRYAISDPDETRSGLATRNHAENRWELDIDSLEDLCLLGMNESAPILLIPVGCDEDLPVIVLCDVDDEEETTV